MLVSGIHYLDFQDIVTGVSQHKYQGNVICKWQAYPSHGISLLNPRGIRWRGQLTVRDSSGIGARREIGRFTNAGERYKTRNACWHVFRDVFQAVFLAESVYLLTQVTPLQRTVEAGGLRRPVRIATAMATYTNNSFDVLYPLTGRQNVGSEWMPVTMPQLCGCNGNLPLFPTQEMMTEQIRENIQAGMAHEVNHSGWPTVSARMRPMPEEPVPVPGTGLVAYQATLDRIDQVLAGVLKVPETECLSCGKATDSPDMLWCTQDCQAVYQAKATDTLWK